MATTTQQPPQDTTLEQVLLGLCLESPDNYEMMTRIVSGDPAAMMFSRRNAEIMQAMTNIVNRRGSIDVSSIRIELTRMGRWSDDDGPEEVMALYSAASSNRSSSIDAVAGYLGDLHRKRMLLEACIKAQAAIYDPAIPFEQIAARHHSDIAAIDTHVTKFEFRAIGEILDGFRHHLQTQQEIIASGKRDIVGQPTGSSVVDYHTGGDKAGELIIVAARPGEGKSTWVLNAAKHGALIGDAQGVLSLEMDDYMQLGRIVADAANVPNNHIQQAKLSPEDWASINAVCNDLSKLMIYLDFCPGLDIVALEAKMRYLVRVKGIKRVFIDYLQLMDAPTEKSSKADRNAYENFNQKISKITKRLKQLAGELGIAVVLLSQMSREVDKRAGEKFPMLSDLRDSGSIEQDANTVLFLYSPYSYEGTISGYCAKFYPHMNLDDMRRLTLVIIAKQRNGKTFTAPIWNDRKYCRMGDIRQMEMYQRLGMVGLLDENKELMGKLGILSMADATQMTIIPNEVVSRNQNQIEDETESPFFPF